jgi:hypothetical protein
MYRRAGLSFPKEGARRKRNDRIGRPATMHANNAPSSIAQAFEVDADWRL